LLTTSKSDTGHEKSLRNPCYIVYIKSSSCRN
jgi:hypothetical protein